MRKIDGRKHDLGGGFYVYRVLPHLRKRMVGSFCFFDHLGPLVIMPGQNIDVRPHPHIGLSTLTYLFEGRLVHRDSLGCVGKIEPGDVNWMIAGRGIAHSERANENDRNMSRPIHGLQFWVALPDGQEDIEPSFKHYDRSEIPTLDQGAAKIAVVAGEAFGLKSPVTTTSPLVLTVIQAKKNFNFDLIMPGFELAVYMLTGTCEVGNERIDEHQMIIIPPGEEVKVQAQEGAHLIVWGGEPFSTPRHIWWNLVSSSEDKIEAIKKQWREGTFPMVPGETEFIPLPE